MHGFLPLEQPLPVMPGDRLRVEIEADANSAQWAWRVSRDGCTVQETSVSGEIPYTDQTTRSGQLFDNSDFSIEIFANRPEHEIAYILAKPLYADPGDSFYYRDCDPQLLSCAIERATGRTLAELVRDGIFNPLGITDYYWEHTRAGHTSGAIALHLRPRDMAKLGQLVLQRGAWQGQQLVPEAWVDSATTTQVELPEGEGREHGWSYGHYWWIVSRFDGFTAWGSGGQYILVVPDKELVIVMVSMPDVSGDAGVPTKLDAFEDLVAPIVNGCGTDR